MTVIAIVQARMGSVRLPNKVMQTIAGRSMIEVLLRRLACAKTVDKIIVATADSARNLELVTHIEEIGFACERGSEWDVLDRYYRVAKKFNAKTVLRITGDCPLLDAGLIDDCVNRFMQLGVDYLNNVDPPTFPDGLDIEVIAFSALEKAHLRAKSKADREHVTTYIRSRPDEFNIATISHDDNLSTLRWTVDEIEDLNFVRRVYEHFSPNIYFGWNEVLAYLKADDNLTKVNDKFKRNEGANMGTGQKLWTRAKRVIPGGNMLLSKRAEMFLPSLWPSYFSRAKGCSVWDLDGNKFIDMSLMGVGTNTLGYGHEDVDAEVKRIIDLGNMSTLNCPEEVYLAEKLVEINPWADMVRFARTGGEANAIAIRIARAASGRDGVAICGYHGWHDWYLSANLADEEGLDGHLLPGLKPKGVPRNLRGTVFPFEYNNIDQLKKIIETQSIGVIKMEVVRNVAPMNGFLAQIRKLATEKGIVLVFDECTSGFRQTYGGLHALYDVKPDMAVYGKALGNGYAITAIVGRREIMESAQSTFISSTFWTERIGPSAALKTLEVMKRLSSWELITISGNKVRNVWNELASANNLELSQWGLPAIPGFTIKSENSLIYKTLITQEMLKKGYLASNTIYMSTEHSAAVLDGYFNALEPIFGLIKKCEDGLDPLSLLNTEVCHAGFKRLN
jgi:glutamate-1-semialdehyde 2,1-aminomutase